MKLQTLEVAEQDYLDVFEVVDHSLSCEGATPVVLRLHFVRGDASGAPRIDHLAETLVTYISKFCFSASRRRDLTETEHIRMFLEAKRLFRDAKTTGQPGELLTYFLIEAILKAPQVVKKMLLTTNPAEERKGSDGLHVRWLSEQQLLEVIFAESKLFQSFDKAITAAFKSMADFHNSATKKYELDIFLNAFRDLDKDTQQLVQSYLRGVNQGQCQEVQVCLIGHDWADYQKLTDPEKRKVLLQDVDAQYRAYVSGSVLPEVNAHLATFPHHHLRMEFFLIPFKSVQDFRSLFLSLLGFSEDVEETESPDASEGAAVVTD